MQTKLPLAIDVSHWNEISDFKLIVPRPSLVICKATEAYPGTVYKSTDDKFERFFSGAMEIGAIRGAYHFHRKTLSPILQAQHFIKTISKMDILLTDLLILDVEEGGEKAAQLWAFLEYVRSSFPNNRQMIYSSKIILNKIIMTQAEKDYFKRITTWTAGYPFFPDLFPTVPLVYTPDQTKYGKVGLWQYSEDGIIQGIQGEADLNWIEPNFYLSLGDNSVGDVSMATFTAECISSDNKVWKDVGLVQVGTIPKGTKVKGDSEKTVSGVKYIHVLYPPITGWTKRQWFNVVYDPIEPPPPPPPADEYIIYHAPDGTERKFVPV